MRERRAKHPKRGSALTQIPLELTHQIWRSMRERQHQNAERVHGRAQKLECPVREHRSQRPQRGGASAQVVLESAEQLWRSMRECRARRT
eukprot:jgi/Chrpa1/14944/Chrysochromulina_OHIO_Genome00011065-RA